MKKHFRQTKRLHKNSISIPESLQCGTYFQNPIWRAIDYNIEPIPSPPLPHGKPRFESPPPPLFGPPFTVM